MNTLKLAWQSIAEQWSGFAWWEKSLWIIFSIPLGLLLITVVALYKPKDDKENVR